jgi:predicted nucleic acid-binding protein
VVAKQYIAEPGSEKARELFGVHLVVSSLLMPLELAAGFHRRLASREMNSTQYEAALRNLADDRARWELVSVRDEILRGAERLVRRIAVRTLDAIHVASALHVREAVAIALPFVTADSRQRSAAADAGLDVIWIA